MLLGILDIQTALEKTKGVSKTLGSIFNEYKIFLIYWYSFKGAWAFHLFYTIYSTSLSEMFTSLFQPTCDDVRFALPSFCDPDLSSVDDTFRYISVKPYTKYTDCQAKMETLNHLFFDCSHSQPFRTPLCNWISATDKYSTGRCSWTCWIHV